MKLANILLLCLLMAGASAKAQNIKFSETQWDFGTIKEDGGDVSHRFPLTNRGRKPIVITNVSTSCGCTTPEYSKRPIMPGEGSSIVVTFNPEFRPGVFSKGVEIYTSEGEVPLKLTIRGEVSPRELTLEEQFPYHIGDGLMASRLYMAFGKVDHSISNESAIELYNSSEQSVRVELHPIKQSGYLKYNLQQQIAPKERATLHAGYLVEISSGYYGKLNDELQFLTNGKESQMILKIRAYTDQKVED
ncbi:MAG: DUF1573 domain-containing protein [Rikenellaceae bacterium]